MAASFPVVEAQDASGLLRACEEGGMFYLVDHGIDQTLIDDVLFRSREFFALDAAEKAAISIKKSEQHRGYGLLKNYRDWREQIHIGFEGLASDPEKKAWSDKDAHYWRLWGANQWPAPKQNERSKLRQTMLAYLAAVEKLSRGLLSNLAGGLGFSRGYFTDRMFDHPYLLLKTIAYLPQESAQSQTGVPAHCDWSWLTLLIQDDVGGLEAQDKNGAWHEVTPLPGTIVVNTGELLEIESGGRLRANPHRVINERIDRQRISVPVFINPALDSSIFPAGPFKQGVDAVLHEKAYGSESALHVHKVIEPGTKLTDFSFGKSEYQRKSEGQWCYAAGCLKQVD